MGSEPVMNHSSSMETYIIPNHNMSELFWTMDLIRGNEYVVEDVHECDQTGSVVWAKGGMVMDHALVGNRSTHSDGLVTLTRDLNKGALPSDVPSSPSFRKVTGVINEDHLVFHCCHRQLKDSLRKTYKTISGAYRHER